MTQHNLDETQRFTGAYNPRALADDQNIQTPHRQETTFISSATGQRHTFTPGEMIDGTYELIELLGRGGMGIVFSCRHKNLGKEYAIKILPEDQMEPEAWSRFQAEAKALARLNHPGIVGIHNMGVHEGLYPYYVMDLLTGETLDQYIARSGALPTRQALDIFIQVADALNSAHGRSIIHRDIKPSNLMLERDKQNHSLNVKLMDFGIARLSSGSDITQQRQTATGVIFGTPYYMSPEQCQGIRVDERSDVYSLGCALFETLTGRPPFCGKSALQTFMMHQTDSPPTLAEAAPSANFDDSLEAALATMLKKNPADRYGSMGQIKHDLERIVQGKVVRERGLVSLGGEERTNIQTRDTHSHLTLVLKISAAVIFLGLATGAAVYKWVLEPQAKAAKFAAEIAKSRKAAAYLAELDTAVHNPLITAKSRRQTKELVAVREQYNKDPRATYGAYVNPEDLISHGISADEFDETTKFNYRQLAIEKKEFSRLLKVDLARYARSKTLFYANSPKPGFQFFDDISIGAIAVDGKKPVLATGFVPARAGADVCLYIETATNETPILQFFGPDDITGLEVVWPYFEPALHQALGWTRLKRLSMFNSLIKAPLVAEALDECALTDKELPAIDKLSQITELGLCGRKITPDGIFSMKILSNLHTLMFKSVANIDEILQRLAPMDNLQEIWLLNEGMNDAQLQPLTKLKNLSTLRIMRSPLTPDSYKIFAQMPKLKTLKLSTSWSSDEQAKFRTGLPGVKVTFERSTDLSYWILVKDRTKIPKHD